MPHQCTKCSRIIPAGSKEILSGCAKCGSHFFFYIRDDQIEKMKETPIEIPNEDLNKIEKDIRELAGIVEPNAPVILDLESIRVVGSGKYEIDVVNLFDNKKPIIYKMDEGKYIIDLSNISLKKKDE
jgi:predicted  nucleic acid-binding Zn-ribbon protein